MEEKEIRTHATMALEGESLQEVLMVQEDRWKEIHRLHEDGRVSIAEIGRRFDLDRKTVRRCLREDAWRPYQRALRGDTLLADHAEYLRERAAEVQYSAQVLFQEVKNQGYTGSYETVKRFVRPLRDAEKVAERATVRFETAVSFRA
jgi:transposase